MGLRGRSCVRRAWIVDSKTRKKSFNFSIKKPEEIQQEYYQKTAETYDQLHVHGEGEHETALKYTQALMIAHGLKSILDVGCGTGRALKTLRDGGFDAKGVEPIQELIELAVKKGVGREAIIQGSGYCLDFPDNSFDAVCSFGVLHHVEHPDSVVREMMRVARRAVFISDANRFGQGRCMAKLIKLLIYKMGWWRLFDLVRTKGKRYMLSEGDGLYYSFSVYDVLPILGRWTNQIILLPTVNYDNMNLKSLMLNVPHILVCAFKSKE